MLSLSRMSLGNSTETPDIQTNKKHTPLRLRISMIVMLPLSGEKMKTERFTWNTGNYKYRGDPGIRTPQNSNNLESERKIQANFVPESERCFGI